MKFLKIETAFVHIPKTAGTFVNHVLRSIYGLSHVDLLEHRGELDATPSWSSALSANEISLSLHMNPGTRSIAGHYLMPTPELIEVLPNVCWFSLFRNPIKRLVSDYRHKCQIVGKVVPFEVWVTKRVNLQIRMLVGTEKAKDLIDAVHDKQLTIIDQSQINQGLVRFLGFNYRCIDWLCKQKPLNVKHGSNISDEQVMLKLSKVNLHKYVQEELFFWRWLQSQEL
jgi:hypothetical protein